MKTQTIIVEKIQQALQPLHLDVVNESHTHNVPPGSESHFKVVVVAEQFDGLNRVKRHQTIYGLLAAELAQGVHALALHTYSPSEWQQKPGAPNSPDCMGGGAKS